MEYMTTTTAVNKWGISERRIRQLLANGRIEGAVKIGNTWNIPINATKPVDKRSVKLAKDFSFKISKGYFNELDELLLQYNNKVYNSSNTLKDIKNEFNTNFIYQCNSLDGSSLSLKETKVVLSGITVGNKSIKEHLQVINLERTLKYIDKLVKSSDPITENNIKNLHRLLLLGIDYEFAGRYRADDPNSKRVSNVSELMEKLVISYGNWEKYHPIVQASLLHGELVRNHPFGDGNETLSILVMNLALMSHGYLPIMITKDNKLEYYNNLAKAHLNGDYTNFIKFINNLEIEAIKDYIKRI